MCAFVLRRFAAEVPSKSPFARTVFVAAKTDMVPGIAVAISFNNYRPHIPKF